MTVVGGLASIFIFFEIIDSWRIFGLNSIYISNFLSFMGFILYGGTPIVLYVTGVGLWLLRPWARSLTLIFLPILLFVFMFNFACNVARKETAMYEALAIDLLIGQFDQGIRLIPVNKCVHYIFREFEICGGNQPAVTEHIRSHAVLSGLVVDHFQIRIGRVLLIDPADEILSVFDLLDHFRPHDQKPEPWSVPLRRPAPLEQPRSAAA